MSNYSRYQKYSKSDGKHYTFTLYPTVQKKDFRNFHIITVKSHQRLDLLAKKYFNNSKLWWIIAMVNEIPGDSIIVEAGTELHIPKDYVKYVE